MARSIDEIFYVAVSNVGDLSKVNRSTGIDVAYLFKEVLDAHSLANFQKWLEGRYQFTQTNDVHGNVKYAYLNDKTLKSFNRMFFYKDRLMIGFRYTPDWQDITSFHAALGNLQGF